jgi:dihydropyrimidinase
MLDLAITGGSCVLPTGTQAVDIGVKDGRIVLVGGASTLPEAVRIVSARDRLVIPGGVDPHIHCLLEWRVPGQAPILTDPASQVSRSALHGGTTTLLDFVRCAHDRTIQEAIDHWQHTWKDACYCDYGFHLMLVGEPPLAHYGQLADAIQDGHASIKIFTTNIFPGSSTGLMMPHGHIWEALKVVAAQGGIACIHAEDNDIVMFMYEKLMRENRVNFEHLAEVHNALSEELSFNRVIRLAENVEGAALYMVHVSAATGVAALEASRQRGFPMYGETLHQYLMYNAEDYKRPGGQMYHTYPSLKYPEDQKRLWEATNRGAIQVIATDELCCPIRVKLQGSRIDDTTGGNSGVEPRVGLMYAQMVTKRGYSPGHFVDMISSNAARVQGLYPRKGALAVGSDADIVLLQTGIEKTIRAADLHETDYTPWEGHVVTAWPTVTILRGKVVVEDGVFHGDLRDGQFLKRKVADEIRSRPAV